MGRYGWALSRISGSHYIYKKKGVPAILSVPVHGNEPLKKGLFCKLLEMSGLSWPEGEN